MVWISTNIEYAFGFWKSCCKAQDSLISNALTTRKGSLNMSDLSSAVSPFHFTIFCLQPSSMSCVGYLEHTMHILYERKFHRVAMVIYARVFVTMCMWVCVCVCIWIYSLSTFVIRQGLMPNNNFPLIKTISFSLRTLFIIITIVIRMNFSQP